MIEDQHAHPARDLVMTRQGNRIYVGLAGVGFVRLRNQEARDAADALRTLADQREDALLVGRQESWLNSDGTLTTVLTIWDPVAGRYESVTCVVDAAEAHAVGMQVLDLDLGSEMDVTVIPDSPEEL